MMGDDSGDDDRDGLIMDEEVNRDKTGEADEMNLYNISHVRATT